MSDLRSSRLQVRSVPAAAKRLRLSPYPPPTIKIVVAGVAVWTTVEGHGPFAQLPQTVRLVSLQAFNASVAITSLLLATVTTERERALEHVRASRARIVEAADAERRRLERDLHDGAQQRLVSLTYTLGLALARLGPAAGSELRRSLTDALDEVKSSLAELRALAHGIHPVALTHEGLPAAVESLAEQAPLPVHVTVPARRYPPILEATAYFIVSEALANVTKHSHASTATVSIDQAGNRLIIEITDDGVGGADSTLGSGLTGLADRVAALAGRVAVESPPGGGTHVRAELPCGSS